MTKGRSLLIVLLLLGLATAARAHAAAHPTLEGTSWSLVTLKGAKVSLPQGRTASLLLDRESSRASGSGGCNRFSAHFTATASGRLTFGEIAATRMFCAGDMDLESRFFKVLGRVHGYRLSGDTLYLVGAGGTTVATLTAGP